MELKICHLYSDVLNLYGDRGNIICMKKRLEWRGIDCSVTKMELGQGDSLAGCDLVFIGGGMEFENKLIAEDLRRGTAAEIKAAVEDGVSFLGICSGFQLLGQYCENAAGERTEMAGAVDMYSKAAKARHTGNYSFVTDKADGGIEVVGFENHVGETWLGDGVRPLGTILCGYGSNGSGDEGLRYKNVWGTYSYGPLLPKNPALCDLILLRALERRYGSVSLEALEDKAEKSAHRAMSAKLAK